MAPAISRHHAEWLALVETSGPFLSIPVLSRALPQGLDAPEREATSRLRVAREEVGDDARLHRSWCEWVVRDLLELDDATAAGQAIPPGVEHRVAEHGETLRPDLAVLDRAGATAWPLLLVTIHEPGQRLDRRLADAAWAASPIDRVAMLCRATGVPLGLTTDGQAWTLVWARPGESTGTCSWDADLWLDEPLTLRAFRTLLGAHRFFAVAEDETLAALLQASAASQQEVTDRLGAQVREAVELLIDALDDADRDRQGRLLAEIANEELYRAAVTVMMRLVFLFVAEERRLLPLDDPLYAESYAASTLRRQLEERATRFGEDPLERSSAAWHRLLALFRAVHGGIEHEALRIPAYGGGLFDPDRYAFLEGRVEGSGWRADPAAPLPVDDRTVLHLLSALQVLREPGRAGQPAAAVRLSFRSLDVEQIGHVYEGLLDHTAVRTFDAALGLAGREEPELALGEIERAGSRGKDALVELLREQTGRSAGALRKALAAEPDPERAARLLAVCENDPALRDRIVPFLGLLRDDLRGDPRVFIAGSLYVTKTLERRSSGTYYTPRSLAEEVVRHALDPVAYAPGPAEESDPERWRLRPAAELLDLKVADIAMGSGAFLVAACRHLAARLLEAWDAIPGDAERTVFDRSVEEAPGEPRIPADPAEREVLAHRLVAERCLYGVDKNPMAVEMAKLSLWLTTLARERPFSFVDHALRAGDSLLGVTSLDQVRNVHMDPARGRPLHENLFRATAGVGAAVERALQLRRELESFAVRDLRDAERKAELNEEANTALDDVRLIGDVVVGAALAHGAGENLDAAITSVEGDIQRALDPECPDADRLVARERLVAVAQEWLNDGRVDVSQDRRAFHWPVELPEVQAQGGFDAIVGNPPFQGGQRITGALGTSYREHLVEWIGDGRRGSADLVAYFFLRAAGLARPGGMTGLLATNTIGQGDTREVGLDQVHEQGSSIARAVPSEPWPGGANLEVAHVWVRRGAWEGEAVLDGHPVRAITTSLEPVSRVSGTPRRLAVNAGQSFQGSNVLGLGFMLTPHEAQTLIDRDSRNADVLMPYLNGEDLNSRPDASPSRWVINFRDWPIERAQEYPDCFEIVERLVKPERAKNRDPRRRDIWWQFTRPTLDLYEAIAGLDRVIVIARVSKTVMPVLLRSVGVANEKVVVFAYDDDGHFGLLSNGFHWWWAVGHSSTLRRDTQYTPTDCFETFPQPDLTDAVAHGGAQLDAHRSALMLDRREGLTKTYNRVHASDEHAEDIRRLREIHVELDHAVRDAYGWTDLDLGHGFHETRQGIRFTFEPVVRQEILDRLLELNLERYAAEEAAGLHAKRKPARRATASAGQTTMLTGD